MLKIDLTSFPALTTSRLSLREVNENDVEDIYFLRSDPQTMRYLDRLPITSKSEALIFIKKIKEAQRKNKSLTWAISLKGEPLLIGIVCYWNIVNEHHRAEVGYTLHPAYQHRGIMHEALAAVLDYGFHRLKLHSVEANVNPENTPSIRLLERHGFTREAYFKENYFFNDKFLDSAIYSLLAPKE